MIKKNNNNVGLENKLIELDDLTRVMKEALQYHSDNCGDASYLLTLAQIISNRVGEVCDEIL